MSGAVDTTASTGAFSMTAEASASQSAIQVERVRTLLGAQAVSQQDYDNAEAAHKAGEAEVAAARAALQSAQINLGYTRVVAPE